MTKLRTRRPGSARIRAALAHIFPCANVFDVQVHGDTTIATICADERGVQLKFSDMPKIAEALGTERLDFMARAGKDIIDSWTFDGCVLNIVARYGENEMTQRGGK